MYAEHQRHSGHRDRHAEAVTPRDTRVERRRSGRARAAASDPRERSPQLGISDEDIVRELAARAN